jgi:uncharacterized membrane protein YjjB (DUF3815 family)
MIITFFYSFMAAMFFSFLFNVPKKSVLPSATIAGIGYIVFITVGSTPETVLFGYFIGTLIMAILSEIAARILKMTTTIFISIGVIPLVPGLGLYQAMQALVENNYSAFAAAGTNTILAAGTMAMAIAISSLLVKVFSHIFKESPALINNKENLACAKR